MADTLEQTENAINMEQVEIRVRHEVGDESGADTDVNPEADDAEEQTALSISKNDVDKISNDEVDKKHLREIFENTQCPLVPSKYDKDGETCGAYYFNNELWKDVVDEDGKVVSCKMIDFQDTKSGNKMKEQAKTDAELMMAVDRYISHVHINKSNEIHKKLLNAYEEKINGEDDGDDSNDAYQKLIPTPVARVMFGVTVFTSALNGYFVISSLITSAEGGYDTQVMNTAALVMGICEVILYADILLSDIFSNACIMGYELMTGDTVYLETKLIATEIRSLSTLSILRYMPSVELVTSWLVHWKETIAKIWTNIRLLFKNNTSGLSVRTNWFARIFSIPVYLVETLAPLMALFAVLVKIKQLEFTVEKDPSYWEYSEFLTFFAFLNQVAGLRVLRKVETASIQHFVFSGADATLNTEELLLLDKWWNVTLLSAVANLKLNWYDQMVFWNALDPQKIQLLLKNHEASEDDEVLKKAEKDDVILEEYDLNVYELLKRGPEFVRFDQIEYKKILRKKKDQ